jgi:uncharacterized protein YodC (DUF2158 family)
MNQMIDGFLIVFYEHGEPGAKEKAEAEARRIGMIGESCSFFGVRSVIVAPKIRLGDEVSVDPNGPTMLVIDVGAHTGCVFCRWVTRDGFPQEGCFPAGQLILINPRQKVKKAS